MSGHASLPMYDFPELEGAHDALWRAIARRLPAAPAELTRGVPIHDLWSSPGLYFSQTCGFPLVHAYAGKLEVVATPVYRAPGCEGGTYVSAIVVRADAPARALGDLRGGICAMNDRTSHSGMNVLRAMIARVRPSGETAPFFRDVLTTGAHAESIGCVARGEADVCAVDTVTHALLARHRPRALEGTRVLLLSPQAPALPYVTRAGGPAHELRAALTAALADEETADARDALLLDGVEVLASGAYDRIAELARDASTRGYPSLA